MEIENKNYEGIGFIGLLQILFIGLKLGNVINWSWFWVLSPIWLPVAFCLGLLAIMAIIALICAIFGE